MIISLDTETTGIDWAHGAMPFLVTWCQQGEEPCFWQWDVDPVTRIPEIPAEDISEIAELLDSADLIYLQNAKFDAHMLDAIGLKLPWHKVRDTLIMGHLLATNYKHDLTSMCKEYLYEDIQHFEDAVKGTVKTCRDIIRKEYPHWKIAEEGMFGMPSIKPSSSRDEDKPWKNDMWLPMALLKHRLDVERRTGEMSWLTDCSDYANADSAYTLYLGLKLEELIRQRKLWNIYLHRLQLMCVDYEMEDYGFTARGDHTESTILEYEQYVAEAEDELIHIASGYDYKLELAEGAALNDNMRDFFYGMIHLKCSECKYFKRVKHWNGEVVDVEYCTKCAGRKRNPRQNKLYAITNKYLDLRVIPHKVTGNATLDSDAMKDYIGTLDEGPALDFIELLADKRMYGTALSYMHQYLRYWLPVSGNLGYYRIHGSFNPCGTDHLRQSSNSPNMQNISGESKEISNKACFGPLPDREWWRMDYRSIEARIPAYESTEPSLVQVFDHPDKPPYWGNLYNLVASILYPDKYAPHANIDGSFKKNEPRLYKRAKFFVLARQYGAGKRKGDLLAGFAGASDMIESGLPLLTKLQNYYLHFAEKYGYVETLPDKTVDPNKGYPILASRTEDGRVLSTTPFNYHTSGTACWVKNVALIQCAGQCAKWREEGFDAHVTLEVHDEIIFDFPRGSRPTSHLWRALELRGIMEQGGMNLVPRIPTPVSMSYHTESWAEEVTL